MRRQQPFSEADFAFVANYRTEFATAVGKVCFQCLPLTLGLGCTPGQWEMFHVISRDWFSDGYCGDRRARNEPPPKPQAAGSAPSLLSGTSKVTSNRKITFQPK